MKKILSIAVAALVGCSLASCSDGDSPNVRKDIELPPASRAGVSDFNRASFELLKMVREDNVNKNFAFSPLSAVTTLAMIANGAEGDTRAEITDFLTRESSIEEINELCASLLPALESVDSRCSVRIVNSLWYDSSIVPNSDFTNSLAKYYHSEVSPLDFGTEDDAMRTINNWVSKNSDGKLQNVISQILPNTYFMFVNNLHFEGEWTKQFSELIENGKFSLEDGSDIRVAMMSDELIKMKYCNLDECTIASIPYGNGAYEMVIFLPEDDYSLSDVAQWLTSENYSSIMNGTGENKMESGVSKFSMPKFRIGQRNFNMIPWFEKLGIIKAFDPKHSDLTGMFNLNSLSVTMFNQSATFEVDERGVKAESSSNSSVGEDMAYPGANNWFVINRPFLFLIREVSTNTILYMGQIVDPREN